MSQRSQLCATRHRLVLAIGGRSQEEPMKTIRAFIWGSAIGAVLGLLFAPQRGDVTRAQLQDRFNEWQGRAQTQLDSLRESASGAIESGKKTVNTVRDQVQGMTGFTVAYRF